MSRYTKKAADKTLIYGQDHALGYFYEEWLTSAIEDEDGRPFTDKSMMFGMKVDDMLEKMHQYRCPQLHIDAVANRGQF